MKAKKLLSPNIYST